MPGSLLGNAVRRVEDPGLRDRSAESVDDLRIKGALQGAFVRIPGLGVRGLGEAKPTPNNLLGAEGIGDSATIGVQSAIQKSVVDALGHCGVRHLDVPCTPQRVWRASETAEAGPIDESWREPPPLFDALPERAMLQPRVAEETH